MRYRNKLPILQLAKMDLHTWDGGHAVFSKESGSIAARVDSKLNFSV